jgi:hypothetical protein
MNSVWWRLPMDADASLSQRKIRNPCPMDWSRMSGDDRVRYCAACGKHVYNLIAMSPDETTSLISNLPADGERTCVRLYQRADGTLFASGCQGTPKGAARSWQFTIRFLMLLIAGCAAVLGFTKWLPRELKQPKPFPAANAQVITGDVY